MTTIPHPEKQLVTLAEAQRWSPADYLLQRKYDGELAALPLNGAVLAAEFMRAPISGHFYPQSDLEMFACCPGGWWAALTVAEVHGQNVLGASTRDRWALLTELSPHFTPDIVLAEIVTDVAAALASGAEGVAAHTWESPWGAMLAHKAESIWTCRVTSKGATQSVGLADAGTGADRGNLTLRGGKCDRVQLGSVIRVAGMGLTESGKIRQPTPCREWLVTV